nr:MAG TPA: hypothetical protein [Caudoviricetes sp.]
MQTPPRGQKVWALPLETAGPPSCEIFSPRGIFGKAPACSPLFDRGGHEFPPTPRPSNCEGRGMRRSKEKQNAALPGPKDCA